MKNRPASSLVVFLGKLLNGKASTFRTGSNRWQLDSKIAKVTSLSPGRDNWANKRGNLAAHNQNIILSFLIII